MKTVGRAFCLSLIILAIHTGVAFGERWTDASTGLTGSVAGVRTLVSDRDTGSTLYALTSGNAVFRSTDGGAGWKALGNIVGVLVLALDPASPSTVYAGGLGGVFKSTDGGDTWSSAGLSGILINELAVDPITPSTLYAAGNGYNIYKSSDGGGSWTTLSLGSPSVPYPVISSLMVDPLTPSTLYAIAAFKLYKSTDAGASWAVIDPGSFGPLLAIAPTEPSTLYALRSPAGLSKSTDGGATWTPAGLTQVVLALAIDPRNLSTLYASVSGPNQTGLAIYRSTDAGKTWNPVNTSLPVVGSLVVSPANSSDVFAASYNGGLFKSTDGGKNWSANNTGLRTLGIQVLVVDPADPAAIYAGADEGLFKSSDGGAGWNLQAGFGVAAGAPPPGLPPPATPIPGAARASVQSLLIDFRNPNILYVGTHRIGGCFFTDINLFKSTDGGATWDDSITPKQSGCMADGLIAMDPTDPGTIYLRYGFVEDGYSLLKSTDGGSTWTYGGLDVDALNALVIDPTSPATLYAGTDRGLFRNTDGGGWELAGLAKANVNLLVIDPAQPNVLYAGTSGVYPDSPGLRALLKSTDSGATWSPINEGLEDLLDTHASLNALILDPAHTNILYAGAAGHGVFKSSDGGATWDALNEGLTNLDVRSLAIAGGPATAVYAGTTGGVFKLVEDGN